MTSISDPIKIRSWYGNGQLSAQWMEKYGKEHGNIICWCENGQKQKEGYLEEGLGRGYIFPQGEINAPAFYFSAGLLFNIGNKTK